MVEMAKRNPDYPALASELNLSPPSSAAAAAARAAAGPGSPGADDDDSRLDADNIRNNAKEVSHSPSLGV